MQTHIAKNIKYLRKKKNVTQEELAAYLNISFQSVSKWEKGENLPDIQTLAALSNYFDVTTDELLGMGKIRGEYFNNEFYDKEHKLMKEKKYDELIYLLQSARKVYPHNIGAQWSLAIALALRGQPGDREEATDMCRSILGDMQYEKIKTATRSMLHIIFSGDLLIEGTDENLLMPEQIRSFIEKGDKLMMPNYQTKTII